jgi:glycosyltransferase involved in cell wall biosynthesis
MKGAHLALEAFGALASQYKNAKLTLVGEGPEEANLRNCIRVRDWHEKVSFIGWQPREKVLSLMQQSDIFLFPSMEGAGMVVLEALATGLPVVCLDYGGPGAMVTSSCGIKVPVADRANTVANLCAGISRLISEPATRRRMGESGRKHVQDNFLWARKSALVETLYDLVDRRGE